MVFCLIYSSVVVFFFSCFFLFVLLLVFNEFSEDIKFASEAIESGRDLYKPDIDTICAHHVELDNMTKNFLMYSSDQHLDECGADVANGGVPINDGHPHVTLGHKHDAPVSLHMLSPTAQAFLAQHPVLNWNYPIFELATLTSSNETSKIL
jgi:hypothetical protein